MEHSAPDITWQVMQNYLEYCIAVTFRLYSYETKRVGPPPPSISLAVGRYSKRRKKSGIQNASGLEHLD